MYIHHILNPTNEFSIINIYITYLYKIMFFTFLSYIQLGYVILANRFAINSLLLNVKLLYYSNMVTNL